MEHDIWPPPPQIPNTEKPKRRAISVVDIIGHLALLAPVVTFFLIRLLLKSMIFDNHDHTIGPDWITSHGGHDIAGIPIVLCLITGPSAVILGRIKQHKVAIRGGHLGMCINTVLVSLFHVCNF